MRRGRTRRRQSREKARSGANLAPAYITRKIPYVDFLEEEALLRIERHAEHLLRDVGIEFRNDPVALDLWRQAGAHVEGVRVRMPDGLVPQLCRTIPGQFVQHARNPARSVMIGGPHTVFAPAYGSPFIRDLEKGRRYGSLEDFRNLVKLTYSLPWLHHSGGVVVEPCDIAVNKRHLDMIYAHIRYTDKPFLGMITARDRAEDSVEMTRILFGAEYLEEHCCLMALVNANSPLMFDKVASEAMQVYAGANQAIIATPFILGGAMGPVTTAGALAQALAEALAAGAFTQIIRPGAPFVMGNFLSSMSMRSGAPTFGMPEPAMSSYVIGQLARRQGIPLRCGGALTAAKICDAQAAYESADGLHSTVMGGANYVLHAAGWLEGGLVMGYEKLVLDADRLGAMHVLLEGFATDDNGLASGAHAEVGPGGHFMGCSHTMANYETAFFDAVLSDSESFEKWQEAGGKDAQTRAYERWNSMLAGYEEPGIRIETDEALLDFMARKKASSEDAWY